MWECHGDVVGVNGHFIVIVATPQGAKAAGGEQRCLHEPLLESDVGNDERCPHFPSARGYSASKSSTAGSGYLDQRYRGDVWFVFDLGGLCVGRRWSLFPCGAPRSRSETQTPETWRVRHRSSVVSTALTRPQCTWSHPHLHVADILDATCTVAVFHSKTSSQSFRLEKALLVWGLGGKLRHMAEIICSLTHAVCTTARKGDFHGGVHSLSVSPLLYFLYHTPRLHGRV